MQFMHCIVNIMFYTAIHIFKLLSVLNFQDFHITATKYCKNQNKDKFQPPLCLEDNRTALHRVIGIDEAINYEITGNFFQANFPLFSFGQTFLWI